MRVCYVPSDMDGPGFYRCLSPGRQLAEHGVEVFMPKREYKNGRFVFDVNFAMPASADIYVWQQWRERFLAEEGLGRIRESGASLVMEIDDNYMNLPDYNPAFLGTHPYRSDKAGKILNRYDRRHIILKNQGPRLSLHQRTMLKQPNRPKVPMNSNNYKHMLNSMRCVDMVTVSTPFLAEVYSAYNKNIRVIRNYVDWDQWEDIQPQYEVDRNKLRIGYLAKFAYRQADLKVIREVIPKFLKAHPEVEFVTNDEETHDFLQVPVEQRVTIGGYDFYDVTSNRFPVAEMTAVCDIGLVPLAANDLNEGKSHLKGMEYNAAGIPFIASPTESYCYWKANDDNGLLAYSESDWLEALEMLVEDGSVRRKMGLRGRNKARSHSIQRHWKEWYDAYYDLAGGQEKEHARKAITLGAIQKQSELGPLLSLVAERKPRTVVEIGTARGGTFWALAQSAHDEALLVSIDIPSGSPMDVRNGKDVYVGRDRDLIKHFIREGQSLRLIDMDSQQPETAAALSHALRGRKIDVLFIDGDHRYEGVKHDFDTYSKFVRKGGIVAFHDIVTHDDKRVGVSRFWAELKTRYRYEEFIGPETWGFTPWGGIGVVYL